MTLSLLCFKKSSDGSLNNEYKKGEGQLKGCCNSQMRDEELKIGVWNRADLKRILGVETIEVSK